MTELWNSTRSKPQIRRDLINALRAKARAVDDAYEDAVERNLDRAHSIGDYRFPTVDIRKTAASGEATEEDVADIFVRISTRVHASVRPTSSSPCFQFTTASFATSWKNVPEQCLSKLWSAWTHNSSCVPYAG